MTSEGERKRRPAESPRKRGWWWKGLILVALVLGGLALRSIQLEREQVTLRIVLHPGDALVYRVTMSPGLEPTAAPATVVATGTPSIVVMLTVTAVDEAGTATLEATIQDAGGEFDRRAFGHGDVFLPLQLPAETRAQITLANDGRATVSTETGPWQDALARFLADLFTPLPDHPVHVEDRWSTEQIAKLDGADWQVEITRWLTAIEADAVTLRIDGAVTPRPPKPEPGTEEIFDDAPMNVMQRALNGSERLSRRDGLLLERSFVAKTTVEKEGSFGDIKRQVKPFLTVTWVRIAGDAAAK